MSTVDSSLRRAVVAHVGKVREKLGKADQPRTVCVVPRYLGALCLLLKAIIYFVEYLVHKYF